MPGPVTDPTVFEGGTLPTYTVSDGGISSLGAGLGAGLGSIAAGAGLGDLALGFYSGIGDLIFGSNGGWGAGPPGFSNPASYAQSIVNGSQTNSAQTLATQQLSNQNLYQSVYQNAIQTGSSPEEAAQYASEAAGTTGNADISSPFVTSASSGAVTDPTSTAAAAATAPTSSSLGTLGTIGAVGGGAAAIGGGALALDGSGTSAVSSGLGSSNLYNAAGATSSAFTPATTTASTGSGLGSTASTLGAVGSLLGGVGAIAKGTGLLGGTGTSVSAPSAGSVAGSILQDEINFAPQVLQTTQQNAPAYSALQQQLLGSQATGVGNIYSSLAPTLQSIQSSANAQQAAANTSLLGQYGSGIVNAYQSANPQLQALQNQYTGLAQSSPSPVGQISGAGSWASPYAQQVQNTVNGSQVNASQIGAQQIGAMNVQAPTAATGQIGALPQVYQQSSVNAGNSATLNQLNQTAQQQLAMGTSVTPQEQATVANEVLSNYNAMGRANDPTAIAGLATGLDTYGQQLLNQREANAQTAAGLQTSQNTLGLQAQQSNQSVQQQAQLANQQTALAAGQSNLSAFQQSQLANQSAGLTAQQSNQGANLTAQQANQSAGLAAQQSNQSAGLAAQQYNQQAQLQGLGLQGSALQAGAAQGLTQAQYNQQAQLANAQYQQSLLNGAASLAQSTATPALNYLMGQSGALTNAYNATGQAGTSVQAGNALSGMYNPFNSAAYGPSYSAATQANQLNAQTNAGYLSGGLSLLGAGLGTLGGNYGSISSALSNLCWIARRVYGETNPRWRQVREWMLKRAPEGLFRMYLNHGHDMARAMDEDDVRIFRNHFDTILTEASHG